MRNTLLKVKDYFSAKLEDYVSEVETEQGITIERWKFLEIFENHSRQYPAIQILPAETKINYGSINKPIIEGLLEYDIDIDIKVARVNPDAESIESTVLGYEAAIRKLVAADETFGGRFLWVIVRLILFSPLSKMVESGDIVKILTIGLTAKNME